MAYLCEKNQRLRECVEVHQIISGFEERQRPRAARAPTPIERDNVDAVNSKMVQEVNAVLKLRERIAELQAAELGNVEQRKLIEEQIAKLKLESVNDAVTLAKAAKRDTDIAALEAEKKGFIGDAHAERRMRLEEKITALKKEGSKANPEEIKALERQAKTLELKKKGKALTKEEAEHQKRVDVVRGQRGTAVAAAAEARGERLKFTLAELSGANLRNVRDPALREDIMKAREVMQLEQQAGFLKQRGGVGDLAEAGKRLSMADKVRAGIKNISDTERFPFANMDSNIASIDETMELLLTQAKTDGLNVRAIMAP